MATKEMRICDVTGSVHKVETYEVCVRKVCGDALRETMIERFVDLCPRSLERLGKFINRGCNPPLPRATKGKAT